MRHRCGIAPALEVYVFEVECVQVAWDDAVEEGGFSQVFAGGVAELGVEVGMREGGRWGVAEEAGAEGRQEDGGERRERLTLIM